jgi:hypothetical protein
MTKYVHCTGIPIPQKIIDEIPGTPPVVISLGNRKIVHPIQ